MADTILLELFAHSAWANDRLLEAAASLTPEQLEAPLPRSNGSIIDTLRHLVGSDAFYLFVIDNGAPETPDTSAAGPADLRHLARANAIGWREYLAGEPNPVIWRREVDDADGFTRDATVTIRVLQALQHASEHRTQVCAGFTALELEPPKLDGWAYGLETETVREFTPEEPSS